MNEIKNLMKNILVIIVFLCLTSILYAAKVDTLDVYSSSMNKNIKTCVITPEDYSPQKQPYPVLYLLHGHNRNFALWVNEFPQVKEFADQYNMIIVGVDGDFSSWYFDSPIDPKMKYETYVSDELISYIDNNFNTIKSRFGRAISGISMGGHGALYLYFRHQNVFGAAGSMSGGVDLRPFPNKWDLAKRLGPQNEFPENWEKHSVINQLHLIEDETPSIIIDCGVEDFFINVNRNLHKKMLYLNIKHDYIERPGKHKDVYWDNALYYQVLFFNRYFQK